MRSTGNAGGNHNLMPRQHRRGLPGAAAENGPRLLVTELLGMGVNQVTGDYSRGAAGFWVENGELAFPVQEITIAGNLKDMFKASSPSAPTCIVRGSRQCGSILVDRMTRRRRVAAWRDVQTPAFALAPHAGALQAQQEVVRHGRGAGARQRACLRVGEAAARRHAGLCAARDLRLLPHRDRAAARAAFRRPCSGVGGVSRLLRRAGDHAGCYPPAAALPARQLARRADRAGGRACRSPGTTPSGSRGRGCCGWPPPAWCSRERPPRSARCSRAAGCPISSGSRFSPCWSAGAGFYWLDPSIHSYAEGLWLAFVTAATVGYGDVVPTTPASRVLAVIIVVIGLALLSVVTASVAAFFIGEDEKLLRREMHNDIRHLRDEVARLIGEEEVALRREMHARHQAAARRGARAARCARAVRRARAPWQELSRGRVADA